jgi:hypothetical protein
MNVHPESKVGKARTQLAALRGQVEPKKQRIEELKRERTAKESLVAGATLDTPAFDVLAAESRIRLLDRAITNETAQLTPLEAQLRRAEIEVRDLESEAESRLEALPELQDPYNPDLNMFMLGRWLEDLAEGRNAVQSLTEAPLAPGARWTVEVTVGFRLLQPDEQVPERVSPRNLRRLEQLERDRAEQRALVASIKGVK